MKRVLAAALALCLLLSLFACAGRTSGKIPGGADPSGTPTAQPENGPGGAGTQVPEPSEEPGGEAAPEGSLPPDEAALALARLRQYMEGTCQAAGAAYLGYRDAAEAGTDLTDWLWTNVPGLMAEMAFLQSVPADRVVGGNYGDLYCVVPRYENTSLAVNHVVWRSNGNGVWPETDEVLYRSEYAQPLLIFVRWEEFQDEPDTEVVIVAPGGAEVTWYPVRNMEDGGYLVLPTGENEEPLLLDFSAFGDVTGLDYDGSVWAPPTQLALADTVWVCAGWLLELRGGGEGAERAGTAALSYQPEDGPADQAAYSGVWRMEGDCLCLELSDQTGAAVSGSFPVYIDLSGERLMLHRDGETHAGLPFFADEAPFMELTLSCG